MVRAFELGWEVCLWTEQQELFLSDILELMDVKGIRYRLVRGVFRASDQSPISDAMQEVIDAFRERLSWLMRRNLCLCEDCGLAPPVSAGEGVAMVSTLLQSPSQQEPGSSGEEPELETRSGQHKKRIRRLFDVSGRRRATVNIAVVGQRDWTHETVFLDRWFQLTQRFPDFTCITGDACGADLLARTLARYEGRRLIVHTVSWSEHGRSAGPVRNALIVRDADLLVAFWDGQSRGTRDAMEKGRVKGIPVWVVTSAGVYYRYGGKAAQLFVPVTAAGTEGGEGASGRDGFSVRRSPGGGHPTMTHPPTGITDPGTLDSVYEGIANALAEARTLALMGEIREAGTRLREAEEEFDRFQYALVGYGGMGALRYAFDLTRQKLMQIQQEPHP